MRIAVDPIACEAHGLCAEILPELIALDDWGYPMIDDPDVPAALQRLARRAVSACPTLALRLRAQGTATGAPRRADLGGARRASTASGQSPDPVPRRPRRHG